MAEARKKLNLPGIEVHQATTPEDTVQLTLFDSTQSKVYNLQVSRTDYSRAVEGKGFTNIQSHIY